MINIWLNWFNKIGFGPSVLISIVLPSKALTEVILSISSLTSEAPERALFILNSTSLALRELPSSNFTPFLRVNTQVSGSEVFQEVAN